jgi:nitrogen fixation-related uncharacterized protein
MKTAIFSIAIGTVAALALYLWAVKRGYEQDNDQDPHSFI